MDPCLLFPVWLFLEHLTAIIDFGSHTRQAQRVPERHLVPGEYRSAEVFLQRGNHSDRAKSIPGDENTFHIGECMLAYGHTWCAASIRAWAAWRSMAGSLTLRRAARP